MTEITFKNIARSHNVRVLYMQLVFTEKLHYTNDIRDGRGEIQIFNHILSPIPYISSFANNDIAPISAVTISIVK